MKHESQLFFHGNDVQMHLSMDEDGNQLHGEPDDYSSPILGERPPIPRQKKKKKVLKKKKKVIRVLKT